MARKTNRKVQYFAGLCAALAHMFTGATLSWPSPVIPKFKNGEADIQVTDSQISWIVSLVAVGALPGCHFGMVLSEKFGGRKSIFGAAVPGLIGAAIILSTKSPELMYLARILIGVTTGMIAVVTMIYITEIADKEIRGSLGMLVQVTYNTGSLLVFGLGPFLSYTALNGILLAMPICFIIACSWIPESPYYHLKNGRVAAARKVFVKLKGATDEKWVDDQLTVIRVHIRESMEDKTTFKELCTNKKYRRAIYIISVLKFLQYMTGGVAIQAYLEMIFRHSSSISGPMASIVYGLVQLVAGVGATFLARYFGRRILMLVSCFGVALSLTTVGTYFYLQDSLHVGQEVLSSISALPLTGIITFNIMYSIGIGTLPYVMQAELFPVNVKAIASSTATMAACIFNFAVTKGYQNIKDQFGLYTVFWFFSFVGYFGVIFIYFFVPETRGKTLEEVQDDMQNRSAEEQALKEDRALNDNPN